MTPVTRRDATPPDTTDLQESEKAHFNPVGLVRSLRDWEGQALDVMVQQDASEFITQFFQQVRACVGCVAAVYALYAVMM